MIIRWKQAAVTRSQNTWSQTDSAFVKHIQFAQVKTTTENSKALSSLLVAVRAPGLSQN